MDTHVRVRTLSGHIPVVRHIASIHTIHLLSQHPITPTTESRRDALDCAFFAAIRLVNAFDTQLNAVNAAFRMLFAEGQSHESSFTHEKNVLAHPAIAYHRHSQRAKSQEIIFLSF